MGWLALKPLKWGDDDIEPGEAVPEGWTDRDYESLVRLGEIAEVPDGHAGAEAFEQATAARDEAVATAAAVEKLRLDDLARAEKLETDLQGANDRATQALTERDEALARAESAEGSLKEAIGQTEALTTERDEVAKQLEDATAPTAAPAAKKPAAKK